MERKKNYITYYEFLEYKNRGQVYEGYVIGYGYAFFESVAINPPHLLPNDSFYPRYVPYEMSFHQMAWQQNIDRSSEAIIGSFGEKNEYLMEGLIREINGLYYINVGFGEILELPIENTSISLNIISENTTNTSKLAVHVKSIWKKNSFERDFIIDLKDFLPVFNTLDYPTYITSISNTFDARVDKLDTSWSFGWDDAFGAVGTGVGLRGSIPHNELFWRQKNGKWNFRPTTKGNYLYNRSYNLKAQRLSGIRSVGTKLGILGGGLIAYDIVSTGELRTSHGINAAMIAISFTGWGAIVSGVWFVADIGTGFITRKSISDRFDDWGGSVTIW